MSTLREGLMCFRSGTRRDLIAHGLRVPQAVIDEVLGNPASALLDQPIEALQPQKGDPGDLDPALVRYVDWKIEQMTTVMTMRREAEHHTIHARIDALGVELSELQAAVAKHADSYDLGALES